MKVKRILTLVITIVLIITLDQVTKFILEKNFSNQYVGNSIIGIEISNNTGLAFGFNKGNVQNICLMVFAIAVILNFTIKQFERIERGTLIAVSFVLGGGISNLIDRFFRGSVLDFIKIYKFPNFNLADAFVVTGWLLIIIFLVIYTRKEE